MFSLHWVYLFIINSVNTFMVQIKTTDLERRHVIYVFDNVLQFLKRCMSLVLNGL